MAMASSARLAVLAAVIALVGCGTDGPGTVDKPFRNNAIGPMSACGAWGGALLICNQAQLEQTIDQHRQKEPWLEASSTNSEADFRAIPGMLQGLVGRNYFSPGDEIWVSGTAQEGTTLIIVARSSNKTGTQPDYKQAYFAELGLEHGGQLHLRIQLDSDEITFRLTRPDGTTVEPDLIYDPEIPALGNG
jgi:hypothetical protein